MDARMDDYGRVARAIRFLEAHGDEQPDLATVAQGAGLSPGHFQRLFLRWAGVSPKGFLQALTLARAKALLAREDSLLEASLEVGLSGPSRLHDLFLALEAMTPGEWKRGAEGLALRWGVHGTPFGEAVFAATARGLCHLGFLEAGEDPRVDLRRRWPAADLVEDPAATEACAREVAARMTGRPAEPLSLVLGGTPFQRQVWRALLEVPEGRLVTYGDLARRAGVPGSARAVGAAVGANPIAYLIPCHRVLRGTGALGGYHWGTVRKRALLGVELARAAGGAP